MKAAGIRAGIIAPTHIAMARKQAGVRPVRTGESVNNSDGGAMQYNEDHPLVWNLLKRLVDPEGPWLLSFLIILSTAAIILLALFLGELLK